MAVAAMAQRRPRDAFSSLELLSAGGDECGKGLQLRLGSVAGRQRDRVREAAVADDDGAVGAADVRVDQRGIRAGQCHRLAAGRLARDRVVRLLRVLRRVVDKGVELQAAGRA